MCLSTSRWNPLLNKDKEGIVKQNLEKSGEESQEDGERKCFLESCQIRGLVKHETIALLLMKVLLNERFLNYAITRCLVLGNQSLGIPSKSISPGMVSESVQQSSVCVFCPSILSVCSVNFYNFTILTQLFSHNSYHMVGP